MKASIALISRDSSLSWGKNYFLIVKIPNSFAYLICAFSLDELRKLLQRTADYTNILAGRGLKSNISPNIKKS
jgi:hypothetical protein